MQLVIVGKVCDGRAQAYVQANGLESVVSFAGELPRSQVFELARTCHMEAHWITVPGLGTATLEAMALGLPTMAWVSPGLYGSVPLEDGVNLLFVKPGDVDQIAAQIERLIESPHLAKAIGQAGRDLVRRYLSWDTAIRDLNHVYMEAVGAELVAAPVSVSV